MVSPQAKALFSSIMAVLIASSMLVPMAIDYVVRPWPGIEIRFKLISGRDRVFTAENLGLALYAELWAVMPPGSGSLVELLYDGRVLGNILYLRERDIRDIVVAWMRYSRVVGARVNPPLLLVAYVYDPSTGYMLKRSGVLTLTYDPYLIASGRKQVFTITLRVPLVPGKQGFRIWEPMFCERRYYWSIDRVYTVEELGSIRRDYVDKYLGEDYLKIPLAFIELCGNVSVEAVVSYNGFDEVVFYSHSILVDKTKGVVEEAVSGSCFRGNFRITLAMDPSVNSTGSTRGYFYVLAKPLVIVMSEHYYDSCNPSRVVDTGLMQVVYLIHGLALNGVYIVGGVDYGRELLVTASSMSVHRVVVENTPLSNGYLDPGEGVTLDDIARHVLGNTSFYFLFSPIVSLGEIGVGDDGILLGAYLLFSHGVEGFIVNQGVEPVAVFVKTYGRVHGVSIRQGMDGRGVARAPILLYIVIAREEHWQA